MPHLRCLGLLLLAILLPLHAQTDRPSLSGTVTDTSGAVVPGVSVAVVSNDTGFRREVVTGAAGSYHIEGLNIGAVTVRFSKPGFRPAEVKNVELAVGQPRTLDARLEVGAVSEAIEVSATFD